MQTADSWKSSFRYDVLLMVNFFFQLPIQKKILLLKAVFCLAFLKITLKLLPFSKFKVFYNWLVQLFSVEKPLDEKSIDNIVWAVKKAGGIVWNGKICLIQSLTTKLMLAKYGSQATLFIGVKFDEQKQFKAHAWVEVNSKLIIGETSGGSYSPLWVWEKSKT